jgi:hypothetical protein
VKPDDQTIPDEVVLLRVLVRDNWHTSTPTGRRASSLAFMDTNTGETSCYEDNPERRATIAARYPGCPVAQFTAAHARAAKLFVAPDPDGDPDRNPEHKVLSFEGSGSAYQKACRTLAMSSTFISSEELL